MSYQVLARKWRPQKFDEVIGQQAVTRTLRNALASGRSAQAFVFAGPRGVGKTTTARILARAFNCVKGPTPDPCGQCDACVEIAEGRDIDVLEIDAATHTGIDNVRDVIVSGLAILPVRSRFKIFIIDEVHQLSAPSFNALLKSIEEPPPHAIFIMATTELEKIPDTVLSRSQVHEFRTISTQSIAGQLRRIADAEQITVSDDVLQLIARDGEGSLRDAESRLDHVIAFGGTTITADDATTVLGLVGRDLLLDIVDAVAAEEASASFALIARAIEAGYDLRHVCRELSRVVRDLLILNVDPSRANDPEIAGEGERERLVHLARRFSREDLLRAFDLLTRAEVDIRGSAQPRYHLEVALLKWIYLRKLVSIDELIAGTKDKGPTHVGSAKVARPEAQLRAFTQPEPDRDMASSGGRAARPSTAPSSNRTTSSENAPESGPGGTAFKDEFLAAIRKTKVAFYQTIVAQAQKIDVGADRVTFTFSPAQRALRDMFEQNRTWLESIAEKHAGRRMVVLAVQQEAVVPAAAAPSGQSALREQALADEGVQALLEVFPAEIGDVEEM
jgi:DNA polymerase-3 subunit gamma/tau